MASISIRQGESSNVFNLGVTINQVRVTDLTGYSCRFAIMDGQNQVQGSIETVTAQDDAFPIRLTPSMTAGLAPGSYTVCAEITNTATEFNRETEISLTVAAQCLT